MAQDIPGLRPIDSGDNAAGTTGVPAGLRPIATAPPSPTMLGLRPIGSSSPTQTEAEQNSPDWTAQAGTIAANPNTSWLRKGWDIANLPLINFNKTNRSGFLGGLEDIASSFTSPLQLALTVGTMGSGSILESGGAAALKAAGMVEGDIEEVTKGAQIASKVLRAGKYGDELDAALATGGVSRSKLNAADQILKEAKLSEDSLFRHGIVHSSLSNLLRAVGVKDVATSEKVGQVAQMLVDGGFSAQGVYQAAKASPRVLDAMRDGDYDTAKRLIVSAGFGGAMGLLGGAALSRDAGSLMEDQAASYGLRVKPTEENNRIRAEVIGKYQGDKKTYQNIADNLVEDQRKRFSKLTPEEKEGLIYGYQAGFDKEQLTAQHNLLMDSAGRPDLKLPVTPNPFDEGDPRTVKSEGNSAIAGAADDFNRARDTRPVLREIWDVEKNAKDIADAYDAAIHDPKNPAVERSYNALKQDVEEQWDFSQRKLGVKFEKWAKTGEPYKNVAERAKDVSENKHLWYKQGSQLPADHPLAAIDANTGLSYSDMFRATHELFGYASEGFEHDPQGEENAWNIHRQMFSDEAVPAMTTETRGQSSWNAFGKHLRAANGEIAEEGQAGYTPKERRPVAPEKAALLPPSFTIRTGSKSGPNGWEPKDIVNHIRAGKNFAILQATDPAALATELKKYGYDVIPVEGNAQGKSSPSLFVPHIDPAEAVRFGRKYNQNEVLTREGLHFIDPVDAKKDYVQPSNNARLLLGNEAESKQNFTVLTGPNGERISIHVPTDDSRKVPPGAPLKVFHGTTAPVTSIEDLDSSKYGQAHDVAGVGTYFTENTHDASQYANGSGRVISGVLRPDTRLLEATNAPMPEAIANAARRVFEKMVRDQNPNLSAQDAFAKYSRSGRDLASPDLTYMDVLDAARRFVSEEKGIGVQDKAMTTELKPLQAMLAKNGYDGVRYSNPSGERRGVMVLPSDVSGRPLTDLLKPAGPWSRLTPEESKLWQSEEAARQARYQELAGQKHITKNWTKDEIERLHRAYQAAIGARPEMRQLGREIRDHFSEWFERAHEKGVVGDAINNYITQIWEKDANNAAANRLASDYRTGNFHTNVSMARERTFANAFEGQLLGRKLAAKDPTAILGNYINKVGEAIAARDAMDRLRDLGLRASDGRPVVALAGTGQRVQNEDGSTTVLVNPKSIRNIRIADKVVKGLQKSGDLDRMIEDGKIIKYETKTFDGKIKSSYLWNTHDYRAVDNSAFQGWNWVVQDEEGNNVLVKSELRVHPEANDYLRRFVGAEPSVIRGVRPLSALMKVGGEAKHFLLSLSPFHIAQEGLRAVMSGVSPFGIEKYDLEHDSHLRMGVEEGLTLGKDNKRLDDYMEGLHGGSKVLSKIPGVRNVQEGIEHFLFDKYIPGLKTRAFRSLYDRYKDLNTDGNGVWKEGWDTRRAAREAAAEVNERFGGLNYTQMGRAVGTQDFMRLAALAPDWLESEVRFAMRLFNPEEGVLARRDFAKMAAYTWVASRVLNLLASGKMHNEAPFGVAVQDKDGKEKVYSIRTMPTDMLHMVSDPWDFMRGRVSPVGRTAAELYTGRDYAGRKLTPYETFVDIARNVAPIPVQGALKAPDVTSPDQIAKALGATAVTYRTEAEKRAIELASNRTENGPVDQAQLLRHQVKMQFEDELRAGRMAQTDIHQMVENGALSVKEAKEIVKNVTETKGLPPEMASLWLRASRLPMGDFLHVWDAATNDEKAALTKLLLKKKVSYFKNANKDETPIERQNDPTYQRLRRMFPQQPPW